MPTRAQVSKEKNTAHVVLCTSDAAFLAWMRDGELLDRVVTAAHARTYKVEWCAIAAALLGCVLGTQSTSVRVAPMPDSHAFSAHCMPAAIRCEFFTVEVIGDFPEAEARRFFKECVLPQFFGDVPYEFRDADWAKVYQVRWLRVACFALCMCRMHARQPTSTHRSLRITTTHHHHSPTHATLTCPLTHISALSNPGVRRQPRRSADFGGQAASTGGHTSCGLGCRCGAGVVCMCIQVVCNGVRVATTHSVLSV